MTIWQTLGIPQTTDQKEIKKAYAARVKSCHREEKPREWAQLHDAYQCAMQYARKQGEERNPTVAGTAQKMVKPLAQEAFREWNEPAGEDCGLSRDDVPEEEWQEYFAHICAGHERYRQMLTEELPERLRCLTLQGEGTQKKRWQEFLQSELSISLYKEPEYWRKIGACVTAQTWSAEACRYIGKRAEEVKYEGNSRDNPELWHVLDELEMTCLTQAQKDPLWKTKATLWGFGGTLLVFAIISVLVRII